MKRTSYYEKIVGIMSRFLHLSAQCIFLMRNGRKRTFEYAGGVPESKNVLGAKSTGLVASPAREQASTVHGSSGFTLVEVLIISPIMMVTIIITMTFLFNQYGQLTQQGAQVNLNVEAQNIAFSMQDDIFFSSAFNQTINDNLDDPYQPGGGWQYNTTPQTLILSTRALTANPRNENRQVVYIDTAGCPSEDNSVLYNNIIYFASGTNLYKRTLTAPTGLATCGASYQKQNCPAASATTDCPADRLITDKLNSFTLTYYDTSNNVVSDPEVAEKIKVDLQLKDRAFAEDIFSDSSITLRKLNQQ